MSDKNFLTISKEECLEVYKNILENSRTKWEAGKSLAAVNDYGGATAMAIISVEEMVKAIVIYLDGKGFEFRRIEGMGTIFRNHQIRYIIAYAMFVVHIFGEELFKFLERIRDNDDELKNMHDAMKENAEMYFEINIKRYALRKVILIRKEFEWFSKVDFYRQDGFYCNYEDQFKSPISINQTDYEQVIQRLEKVRYVGKRLIVALERESNFSSNYLGHIRRQFKQQDYYQHIGKGLTVIRKSRESPFAVIREYFTNL